MTRMVALLRGINVGGKPLKNAHLVAVFEGEGFTHVRAVLASGNIVFDSTATNSEPIRHRIESALTRELNYEAKLVLESQVRLKDIAAAYPFERDDETLHPYIVFSSSPDTLATLVAESTTLSLDIESVAMGVGVVYWRVPRGSSLDSPFARVLARKNVAQTVTTRNLRTVEKLTVA